jgi:ribosome biogenesis GTPase / thiamine phosphate phosphatase
MPALKIGRVLRTDAKVCYVEVDGQTIQAAPRGILYASGGERTGDEPKNPVAVGDRVEIDDSTSPAGLESVLPRKNALSRIASSHDPREQILAANVDQLFVVGSIKEPLFSSSRTDRILAACAWNEIPAVVVLNKIDLVEEEDVARLRETYERIPVPVIATCAIDGRGLDELRARLEGKTSVFYGSSGAGKSTLLNRIQPGLKLKEGRISRFWDTGKHTTSFSQLYKLDSGACVIDTPGIRVFRLHGVTVANLPDLFPEFEAFAEKCQFDGCSHDHEPDCGVFDAVDRGELAASRYASYVEMLDEMRGSSTPAEGGDAEE